MNHTESVGSMNGKQKLVGSLSKIILYIMDTKLLANNKRTTDRNIHFLTKNVSLNCVSKGCKTTISLDTDMNKREEGDKIEKRYDNPNTNRQGTLLLHTGSLTTKVPL